MYENIHRPLVVGTSVPFPFPGDTALVRGPFGPRLVRVAAAGYDSAVVIYEALSASLGRTLGRDSLAVFLETWRGAELVPMSGVQWGTFRRYLEVREGGQVPAEEDGFTAVELKKFERLYDLTDGESTP